MKTARPGTKFYAALRYIIPAIGWCDYWIWRSGIIPDGPGAWAKNADPPEIEIVKRNPLFCAAVPNLMLRHAGHKIPSRGDDRYDGGIAAYWHGKYGPGWYQGYEEPFNLRKAKEWSEETGSGVLIGHPYWGEALADQGHVGILLPSGYVLQSNYPDGLNWDYTIEQSHDGGYYTHMVHPKDWINFS